MKANELRIGNYIKQGKIWYLEVSEDGSYMYKAGSYGSNAEPIPLTEEWLLKFGFSTLSFGNTERVMNINDSSFIIEFFEYTGFYHYSGGEGVKLSAPIQYVHQLQNLVFAVSN